MQSMTIDQLRTANEAGGVEDVTLKGTGGNFLVEIAIKSGGAVVLAKARSTTPRLFGNPLAALNALREVGITIGRFDASSWNPAEKRSSRINTAQSVAMRQVHEAANYTKWLAAEIQASIDDPRESIPNDDVMARINARIAKHSKASSPA